MTRKRDDVMFTSPLFVILPLCQLLQLFPVQHLHAAPEQPHPALLCKVFQHPAHHLAGGAHVLCHLVVGHAHLITAGLGQLIGEKNGKPAVCAHEQHLLHGPHAVGKALCRHLVGVAAHMHVLLHQPAEDARADAVGFGVLFGPSIYRSMFTESITQEADRMHTSPPNRR